MSFKRIFGLGIAVLVVFLLSTNEGMAQCSICSKVASDLSEGAAKGLNAGILYLLAFPISFISIAGYKWYKNTMDHLSEEDEEEEYPGRGQDF